MKRVWISNCDEDSSINLSLKEEPSAMLIPLCDRTGLI